MKFCPECGARLADEVVFCTDCGVYLIANNPVINEPVSQPVQPPEYVQQPQYIHPQQTTPVDDPYPINVTHKGFWWLGFILPPLGLVLFIVWKRLRPRLSRSAGKGALTGAILSAVFYTLYKCSCTVRKQATENKR